mgnify:CR=1 FL=1
MIKYMLIMLTGTFVSSVSQIILKKAAQREYPNKLAEYLNPQVIIAYLIFFGATLCAVTAYRVVPLSIGPMLEATGYIWVAILGRLVLGEHIGRRKALGLIVIVLGIIIASMGSL